ncbi:MAG: alpha/beta hydrolase [Geitlerinemataceae cyanobacterium]
MPAPDRSIRLLAPQDSDPDRPLFIYLPGMDGSGQLLHLQISHLKTTFDIRCLTLPHHDNFSSWFELASQTVNAIQTELMDRSNRTVYLCGESFGGCLAMQVTLQAPKLIDRLILVNPASSFKQRPWMSWGTPFIRWVPQSFYQVSAFGLLPYLASWERVSQDDRQMLLQAMQSVAPSTASWRLSLLRVFGASEAQLSQLHQPTLLVAGQRDRLLPSVSEAQNLARILPNARSIVLPDSGHACLLEHQINLYQILQEAQFLSEAEASSNSQKLH